MQHRDNPLLAALKDNLQRTESFLAGTLQPYNAETVTDTSTAKAVRAMSAVRCVTVPPHHTVFLTLVVPAEGRRR
jgi:hypothetical protein